MSRMNFGFFAAVIVSLIAFSTSADAQIGTLLPKIDELTGGQAMFSSLEDVIQKTSFERACESSCQVWQFDETCTGECGDACTGECGKTCSKFVDDGGVSEQIWKDADLLVASLPTCDCEKCDQCPSLPEVRESTTDSYCQQMAGLLAVTLNGSHADPEAQRRAIEAALKMVAENAQIQAEARIAKLELKYERSFAQFQQQIDRLTVESHSVDQFRAWLHPIYSKQTLNFEQIQKLAASNASLSQSIGLLGRRIANLAPSKPANQPQDLRFTQPQYMKDRSADFAKLQFENAAYKKAEELEIQNLRRQIETLDRQLERLTKPVRRADYLEPIFTPDQPLEPLQGGYPK